MGPFYRVRNWEKFQHYKDRNPPWIKLHTELLDNYEFSKLSDAHRWHLVGIWMLAARLDNRIPADPNYLARVLNTKNVGIEELFECGFLEECDEFEGKGTPWPSRYISSDLRSEVLRRDLERCKECQSTENLEIDHIIPVSKGGQSVLDNLQVLCRPCNRRKRTKSIATEDARSAEQLATQSENMRSPRALARGEAEERRGRGASVPPARKQSPWRRFPEGFDPVPFIGELSEQFPGDFDFSEETRKLKDHEFKNSHTDALATWRKWMRTARDQGNYARRNVVVPIREVENAPAVLPNGEENPLVTVKGVRVRQYVVGPAGQIGNNIEAVRWEA